MVGTSYYVAPEVLFHDYDEQSDMWSLGVVLYIMLTGRPPFNGMNDIEIVKKVRLCQYSMHKRDWLRYTPACVEFVKKLLHKDPMGRMTAEQALKHPWIK